MTQRYPLHWPAGWQRARHRKSAPFKVPPQQARKEMMEELNRLGALDIVVSTDQPINRDGSPSLVRRQIDDPGVAVYFKRKGRDVVLACDQYDSLHDNMRAISKTVEAMRGIERWGASDMLDRAFTGFEALAAPEQWWQVLGVDQHCQRADIESAYRTLARSAHPDSGGSDSAMSRLNVARVAGLAAVS
jgi:DnaJ domain